MTKCDLAQYRALLQKDPKDPRAIFPGEVNVVETLEELSVAIEAIRAAGQVGFDTETRPAFTKNTNYRVALIQMATDSHAWLIRTSIIGLPKPLRDLLEDPALSKIGVSVRDDILRLRAFGPYQPAGFIDIQPIARAIGFKEQSLAKLAAKVLNLHVSKKAQLTNWEAETLKPNQILYAATDAWIPLMVYRSEPFQNYITTGGAPIPLPREE